MIVSHRIHLPRIDNQPTVAEQTKMETALKTDGGLQSPSRSAGTLALPRRSRWSGWLSEAAGARPGMRRAELPRSGAKGDMRVDRVLAPVRWWRCTRLKRGEG